MADEVESCSLSEYSSALRDSPRGRRYPRRRRSLPIAGPDPGVATTLGSSSRRHWPIVLLFAGLGVGGIAIALAAQKTIENLFGGITLYGDSPVRVGDFCRFGDKVGTVEEIGIRSTRVRTLDRTVVTIPNADFSNLQLENFAKRDRMRLFAMIGVRYETTPDQLRYILVEVRKLLYAHERVTADPARIRSTWSSSPTSTRRTGASSSESGRTSICGSWTSSSPVEAASPSPRRRSIWERTTLPLRRGPRRSSRSYKVGASAAKYSCQTSRPSGSRPSRTLSRTRRKGLPITAPARNHRARWHAHAPAREEY